MPAPDHISRPIKVLFLKPPGEGKGNPYRPLLYKALQNQSAEVGWTKGIVFPFLRTALTRGLPDVIHFQWQDQLFLGRNFFQTLIRTGLFFLELTVLKASGVKFVWTVHNLVNHRRLHVAWETLSSRLLARLVDKIVVHCQAVKAEVADFLSISQQKITAVRHGHYQEWYPPGIPQAEARQRLGLPEDQTILLYFGRILKYKGADFLVEAFSKLASQNVSLYILGEPESQDLENEIIENAHHHPGIRLKLEYITDQILVEYLSACDLVVLPYRDILTSGSVILAFSLAKPVLVPALGCLRELPSGCALLYNPQTADGLLQSLSAACMLSRERLSAMGLLAEKYISENAWEDTAREMLQVYRSAVDG